ncbi:hypothetical protein AKJ09_06758 [Labilithrix luteola]|uniref:Uncharacterized protein n=1 Tax=Labilithrix luteola TaxID=1391654 RepID=A0A0K1Q3X9_9BACT|nr:hypothetical protein AKJ09_06758 [Labilithrix luteola]
MSPRRDARTAIQRIRHRISLASPYSQIIADAGVAADELGCKRIEIEQLWESGDESIGELEIRNSIERESVFNAQWARGASR